MKRYQRILFSCLAMLCFQGLLYNLAITFELYTPIEKMKYQQIEQILSGIDNKLNNQQPITCSTGQDYSNQFYKLNKRLDSLEMGVSELNLPLQNCVNDFNTLNNMLWHK